MDLDEEKLKATRKLHGLDKENGSDINVGSIEEDIKKVKELNNLLKFFKTHGWIPDMSRKLNTNATIESIEHLLSDYTRQKQINEEHQKTNGELREKVKELIKEKQELTSALLDSIPIQKMRRIRIYITSVKKREKKVV